MREGDMMRGREGMEGEEGRGDQRGDERKEDRRASEQNTLRYEGARYEVKWNGGTLQRIYG